MTIPEVLATLEACDFAKQTLTLDDIVGIRDALAGDLPGVPIEVYAHPPAALIVRAGDIVRQFVIGGFDGPSVGRASPRDSLSGSRS
jgi:hypothetical protein